MVRISRKQARALGVEPKEPKKAKPRKAKDNGSQGIPGDGNPYARASARQELGRLLISLPWPPTVNTYWRRKGGNYFISAAGKAFRKDVVAALTEAGVKPVAGSVWLTVALFPPDNRKRDIDNVLKAVLDGLKHGGAYLDDCQVKKLSVEMLAAGGGSAQVCMGLYEGS